MRDIAIVITDGHPVTGDYKDLAVALQELGVSMSVPAKKEYADLTGFNGGTAFAVTGLVKFRPIGKIGTAINSTSGTTVLQFGTAASPTAVMQATVDGTNLEAGGVWVSGAAGDEDIASSNAWFYTSSDLLLVPDTDDLTQGSLALHLLWEAVEDGATLTPT